jgi:hypothetical protein
MRSWRRSVSPGSILLVAAYRSLASGPNVSRKGRPSKDVPEYCSLENNISCFCISRSLMACSCGLYRVAINMEFPRRTAGIGGINSREPDLGVSMRIFVQPHMGDSFDRTVRNAVEILHTANILSARAGGTIDGRSVLLVDPEDLSEAMATLERDGLRATVT